MSVSCKNQMLKEFKKGGKPSAPTKKGQLEKLSEDMENEIKDAFNYYDKDKSNKIKRNDLRSVLGNFAYTKMNGKEIESEITKMYGAVQETFTLAETLSMITKKWFDGGREAEAEEMFSLFDRKEKGLVGLNEIKHVFNQYLDIVVSDADIQEFIEEADLDKDGYLNKDEFFTKLGYK